MPELTALVRSTLEFLTWMVLIRYVHFMILYVRVIWPLKKQIKEGAILAPPARTTLAFHCAVFYLVLVQSAGTMYALAKGFPLNPFTAALIPGMIALLVIVHLFAKEYRARLVTVRTPV